MPKNLIYILLSICLLGNATQAQPIKLHSENPRYLSYKGTPTLLITSAEHYGAVLNLDFDYKTYLQTLANEGMNYTRIFAGSYVEVPGSFGIGNNTLAPEAGRFITPWLPLEEEGLYKGDIKLDLSKWNETYFDRLKDFVNTAAGLDIIVELTFFCSTYTDDNWGRSPFNPKNNINNLTNTDRKKSNTLGNGNLVNYQKAMVNKIVVELNEFDNLFYEIQNEPWSDAPVPAMLTLRTVMPKNFNWAKQSDTAPQEILEWQKEIAETIEQTEMNLPKKHLVAQNYANFFHAIPEVEDNISIINFHYAWPQAVWMNYGWEKPISYDESGFSGSSDTTYLRQAWQFMLAGGAVFNNLDYSFSVGNEQGTGEINAPGGGSTLFRKQLTYLHQFLKSVDFVKMQPDHEVVYHAPGVEVQALSEKGKQYAFCLTGPNAVELKLKLPEGNYSFQYLNPFSGENTKTGEIQVTEEITSILVPQFDTLVGLKILAID